jgi:hypothetical protein
MNKYYSATDESKVYRVAMGMSCPKYSTVSNTTHTVLHPDIKLEYFRSRRWEREWVDTAKSLVRAEYDSNYAHLPAAADGMDGDKSDAVRFVLYTLIDIDHFHRLVCRRALLHMMPLLAGWKILQSPTPQTALMN